PLRAPGPDHRAFGWPLPPGHPRHGQPADGQGPAEPGEHGRVGGVSQPTDNLDSRSWTVEDWPSRRHAERRAPQRGEQMVTRAIALVLVVIGLTACGAGTNAATLAADQKKADILAIEHIEKTWHQASSTHDVDLMMTIWSDNATATLGGQTYTGKAQIREFFATKAGPFQPQNHWVSETPAYKIRVTVDGDKG